MASSNKEVGMAISNHRPVHKEPQGNKPGT